MGTNNRWTPGPWQVVAETEIMVTEHDGLFAIIADTNFWQRPPTEEQRANAQLIAAAPLLAETLGLLLSHTQINNISHGEVTTICLPCDQGWVIYPQQEPERHDIDCPVIRARAALARARGEEETP